MRIVVKSEMPGVGTEWIMIEMQGQLESPEDEQLSGQFIGDLHFNRKGVPVLIIGHHILYGKVSTLEKPFVVLKKNNNHQDNDEMETIDAGSERTITSYTISAVVRKKLIFKTRPKPIITNVPKRL